MTSKRRSPIWKFFTTNSEEDRLASCDVCNKQVSRGGSNVKTFTTTNLVAHLRKHPTEYQQYLVEKSSAASSSTEASRPKQLTLEETESRVRIWDINDPRSVRITRRIAEMIAIDCQPISVVDDLGFVRVLQTAEPRYSIPSRKYITESILPDIHANITAKVKDELARARWISLTSDIWSTQVSNESLISLTAHWVSDQFERKSLMLQAAPFPGSHTADAIRQKYQMCGQLEDR